MPPESDTMVPRRHPEMPAGLDIAGARDYKSWGVPQTSVGRKA